MIKILGIFTCYNRKECSVACLKSLMEGNKSLEFTFLAVDDASTDGTAEALEDLGKVNVLEGNGGLYYSGGMRKGIEEAKGKYRDYDYCLLFNDDVKFYAGAVERMVKLFSKERQILVGCLLYTSNLRRKLKIPIDAFVIGHVGRFSEQKNHKFLVSVFEKIHSIDPKAFLLMIGMGDQQQNIEMYLNKLGLQNNYMILSNRTDIPNLLSIMDIFVFPSLYEGAPITLIEAQKVGVPCFVSNNISRTIKISNLIHFWPLDLSSNVWAQKICSYKKPLKIEYNGLEKWDINEVIKDLESIYEESVAQCSTKS